MHTLCRVISETTWLHFLCRGPSNGKGTLVLGGVLIMSCAIGKFLVAAFLMRRTKLRKMCISDGRCANNIIFWYPKGLDCISYAEDQVTENVHQCWTLCWFCLLLSESSSLHLRCEGPNCEKKSALVLGVVLIVSSDFRQLLIIFLKWRTKLRKMYISAWRCAYYDLWFPKVLQED